ncbi:MAG: hypothetical protein HYZ49_17590 [Chloroflexi bacterium]|nr:hypothetical protein [Chloroflexota bacterium]
MLGNKGSEFPFDILKFIPITFVLASVWPFQSKPLRYSRKATMPINCISQVSMIGVSQLDIGWHDAICTVLSDKSSQPSFDIREIVPVAHRFVGAWALQAKSLSYRLKVTMPTNRRIQIKTLLSS